MKTRYRLGFEKTGLFSKKPVLVLQVFARVKGSGDIDDSPMTYTGYDEWRDATVADLTVINLECAAK